MKLQITAIEFDIDIEDFDQDDSELLQERLQSVYVGQFWDVDEEDELADLISDKSGWCVSSINYREVK